MPAIAAISINDGKATPVAHVFSPVTTDGSTAEWANRAASMPQGFEGLKVNVRKPQSPTGAYRIDIEMSFPVLATVNGVETVVRTSKFTGTYYSSAIGPEADRKDHRVLLSNLFGSSAMASIIEKLEPAY